MNVFRLSVIILTLSLVAGGVVHIRLMNWHYGYLINQQYDQYQRQQRKITQDQLEVARLQSPDNLLGRLKEMKLPLEGFGLAPTPAPTSRPTTKPAKEGKARDKAKSSAKRPAKRPASPTQQ